MKNRTLLIVVAIALAVIAVSCGRGDGPGLLTRWLPSLHGPRAH